MKQGELGEDWAGTWRVGRGRVVRVAFMIQLRSAISPYRPIRSDVTPRLSVLRGGQGKVPRVPW